jgi:hypothetical protein
MLMAGPRLIGLIGFVLTALILVAWVVSGSQAFQSCFQDNKYTDNYRALYESVDIITKSIIRLRLNAKCSLIFFDKDSGALTALATIAIAWFTWTLRQSNEKLWGATKIAADAAKQSADALVTAERAYVSVKQPETKLIFDHQSRTLISLRVWVVWKNSGSTPAGPMRSLIGATFTPDATTFTFPDADKPDPEIIQMVLGPEAEITSGWVDIGAEQVRGIVDQTGHEFVWGWTIYRDVFPNSPEHLVEFCYKVSIEGSVVLTNEGKVDASTRFSLHGNRNRYYDKPLPAVS